MTKKDLESKCLRPTANWELAQGNKRGWNGRGASVPIALEINCLLLDSFFLFSHDSVEFTEYIYI